MTGAVRTRARIARVAGALLVAGLAANLTACAGAGRDVVPESHDVVGDAGTRAAISANSEGYEYIARRPIGVVALAEARGIDPGSARAAIDQLADRLGACVIDEAHKRGGPPSAGAARVVAQIGPDGAVAGTSVRIDPGSGSAPIAVVCLVAPVKQLTFAPSDNGARGLAIEAIWGHVQTSAPPGP